MIKSTLALKTTMILISLLSINNFNVVKFKKIKIN